MRERVALAHQATRLEHVPRPRPGQPRIGGIGAVGGAAGPRGPGEEAKPGNHAPARSDPAKGGRVRMAQANRAGAQGTRQAAPFFISFPVDRK